jgi:hypothetical protein
MGERLVVESGSYSRSRLHSPEHMATNLDEILGANEGHNGGA